MAFAHVCTRPALLLAALSRLACTDAPPSPLCHARHSLLSSTLASLAQPPAPLVARRVVALHDAPQSAPPPPPPRQQLAQLQLQLEALAEVPALLLGQVLGLVQTRMVIVWMQFCRRQSPLQCLAPPLVASPGPPLALVREQSCCGTGQRSSRAPLASQRDRRTERGGCASTGNVCEQQHARHPCTADTIEVWVGHLCITESCQ